MPRSLPAVDRVALALVVALGALTLAVGLRASTSQSDIDELVYRRTLVSMNHGDGYYAAMRKALVRKEGAPPTQVRSVRPPTMFLLLYAFPPRAWRWLVGVVFFATLALAWRLGRLLAWWAGPVPVCLAAIWLLVASPRLYLHSELWGAPFVLGGALALRHGRWATAALLLGAAVLFRETYAAAFVAGLVWSGRRRPFWIALAGLVALGSLHVWLAQGALATHGRETPLGTSHLTLRYALNAVSPFDSPLGWVLGLGGLALGAIGLAHCWRRDVAARLLLTAAAVLVPATILWGREYWALTFGIEVACFVPAGIVALTRRPVPAG